MVSTRHFVESFSRKIKRYRRVATRYEKTATNFLGFVLFAALRGCPLLEDPPQFMP